MKNKTTSLFLVTLLLVLLAQVLFVHFPYAGDRHLLQDFAEKGDYFNFYGNAIFYINLQNSSNLNNQTLLLLHGFPTNSYDYEHLFASLLQRFSRIIAIDFLGFGLSDKPQRFPYSISLQTDVVTTLMRHLQLEHTHILAHDYAVSVAQELLARTAHPYNLEPQQYVSFQIQSITFLNGGLISELHRPILVQRILLNPYLGPLFSYLGATNYYTFSRSFDRIFGDKKPTELETIAFWTFIRHKQGHLMYHELIHYIRDRRANRDRWLNGLLETKVPIRVVIGPKDPVSGIHLANALKEYLVLRDKVFVLDDSIGHYPQVEDAEAVLQHVFAQTSLKAPIIGFD